MTGALPAVQERLQCPIGEVDVIVGTSAGSILAAALRCGASIEELIAYQRGELAGALRNAGVPEVTAGPWPPLPRWPVGSPRLMLASVLAPHRMHLSVSASAWLPRGRARHEELHALVDSLHRHAHRNTAPDAAPPGWVGGGQTWIVAVDYDSGRRVIFGRAGAPQARLADAVVASCSIPGWYEPARIAGRRYIDGGVRSPTSLGLVARADLDEVYVLAPLASVTRGRSKLPHERLERRLRQLITVGLLREAEGLRSAGIRVTVLTPGPEDLTVMGVNPMDPRRRKAVLETSLRSCPHAFAIPADGSQPLVA
jgi:NTE family protein